VGSTEWGEQHPELQKNAVAYFNTDMAVSGPRFGAAAVPSLKQFVREITKAVSDPDGETVYERWKAQSATAAKADSRETSTSTYRPPLASSTDVPVSDLGSGSDFTVFLQHLGIASTDIGSVGDYGVYHSAFDNFAWFTKFGDPTFAHEQKMARIFGLEVVRMADCDVLPYDFEQYGKEVGEYIAAAEKRAAGVLPGKMPEFEQSSKAAKRFAEAGAKISLLQRSPSTDAAGLNAKLVEADRALLLESGLPGRPWFRHAIYAPGKHAGYAAAVIPGVNDSIDDKDFSALPKQLRALRSSLEHAASILEEAAGKH
ncbi:MAG TPA: transferrin receptor-like dimerization domain-containing protein, partial [Terriglobales bacterium]|nr:transferrin receptor-like dimerization domain-containing protein [Terriglobales bacterium]